jgi:hypothetical protein
MKKVEWSMEQGECDLGDDIPGGAEMMCTRDDIAEVLAVGLRPVFGKLDGMETLLRTMSASHHESPLLSKAFSQSSVNPLTGSRLSYHGHDHDHDRLSKSCSRPSVNPLTGSRLTAEDGTHHASSVWDGDAHQRQHLDDPVKSVQETAEGPDNTGSGMARTLSSSSVGTGKGMQTFAQDRSQEAHGVIDFVHTLIVHKEMVTDQNKKAYYDHILQPMLRIAAWWDSLEEPSRYGCLQRIVGSSGFETICASVIVANSLFVAYTANWEMSHLNETPPMLAKIGEYLFAGYYAVELCMRLALHRLYFFVNADMRWNIFDFILVMMSIVDTFLILIIDDGGGQNLVFMRIIRLCKLAKILRAFRAMRFFKDLAVMFESFKNSFVALFWSFIMLLFVLYVSALVFLQAMTDTLSGTGVDSDHEWKFEVEEKFGTMLATMLSLYMSVTGGNDWSVYYQVIAKAGPFYAGLYVLYTFFFTFALFNILTGIFVEKAVCAATPDRDDLVLVQRRKARQDAAEFRHLCHVLSGSQKDTVTWEDFERQMHNEVMVAYMAAIGLEVHDVELFFKIVAGTAEHGEVSIDRFVEGCMQMRGAATGIDMQRELFELHMLHKDVKRFETQSNQKLSHCIRHIEDIAAHLMLMHQNGHSLAADPAMSTDASQTALGPLATAALSL